MSIQVIRLLNSWETYLQKSIDFLLNPFFVFRNDLYVNLLHYMYTCCYTKMKLKFKLDKEIMTKHRSMSNPFSIFQ